MARQIKHVASFKLIYEIVMAALALVVAGLLYVEFTMPISEAEAALIARIDLAILIIFALDYFYRLIRAENRWVFIKSNVFDLIAIMPFDKVFRLARLFRLARFARLSRLSRLVRPFAMLSRLLKTAGELFQTNGLLYIFCFTVGVIFFGAFAISMFEDDMTRFSDALWWSFVTATTVGYGDLSPSTGAGRIVAVVLMIVGIGFIGMLTGSIATYFVSRLTGHGEEPRQKSSVAEEQLALLQSKLNDLGQLNREDVDLVNRLIIETWEAVRKEKGDPG